MKRDMDLIRTIRLHNEDVRRLKRDLRIEACLCCLL